MGYLVFRQLNDFTDHVVVSGINYDVTRDEAGYKWLAYIYYRGEKFIHESGRVATEAEGKAACESHYTKFYNLPPKNDPVTPEFVSTIPHVDRAMPGVNQYAQPYHMNRFREWAFAERHWASLLSSYINAPKPDIRQYYWNPDYSWFEDYGIDPNAPLPPRPN